MFPVQSLRTHSLRTREAPRIHRALSGVDAGTRDALSRAEGTPGRAELAAPRREPPVSAERPSTLCSPERSDPAPPTAAVSDRLCGQLALPVCGFHVVREQRQASPSHCRSRSQSASPGSWDRRRRPKANHTAARSCDWMAVSANWLPPGVSASLPFLLAPNSSSKASGQ